MEGEQQPNAKRDEETERCDYNDPHQFRQAPMIDVTSTQTQGSQRKRPTRLDPFERIVVQHFRVWTFYPKIYVARTRRAVPPDPAGTQPRTPLQRRPNLDH